MDKVVRFTIFLLITLIWESVIFSQEKESPFSFLIHKLKTNRSGELEYDVKKISHGQADTIRLHCSIKYWKNYLGTYAFILHLSNGATFIYDLNKIYTIPKARNVMYVDENVSNLYDLEDYLYKPILKDLSWFYFFEQDKDGKKYLRDTAFNGDLYRIYHRTQRYKIEGFPSNGQEQIYYFDLKDSLPVYSSELTENSNSFQFLEYRLLSSKLDTHDSSLFFMLLNDSIHSNSKNTAVQNGIRPGIGMNDKKLKIGNPAPNFKYYTLGGEILELEGLLKSNKLVLIDFWYNGCGPCRKAFPKLVTLYEKFKSKGLEIIGLNPYDTNHNLVLKTIRQYGISYPTLFADQKALDDYGIDGFPTIFLLNTTKEIIFSEEGFSENSEKELTRIIGSYLN